MTTSPLQPDQGTASQGESRSDVISVVTLSTLATMFVIPKAKLASTNQSTQLGKPKMYLKAQECTVPHIKTMIKLTL